MNNQLRGYATVDQKITINYQNSAIVLSRQLLRLKSFEYFKITVKKEHHMLLKAIKQLKLILQS